MIHIRSVRSFRSAESELEIKNARASVRRKTSDGNRENYSPEVVRRSGLVPDKMRPAGRGSAIFVDVSVSLACASDVETGIETQRIRNNDVHSKLIEL